MALRVQSHEHYDVSGCSWSLGQGFKVSSPMYLQKCNLTLLYSCPNMNKCSHSLRVSLHMFTLELCVSALILFQMWPMFPKLLDYLPSNNRHHTIWKTVAAVPNVRVTQTRQKMEVSRIAGHLKVFILLFYVILLIPLRKETVSDVI